MDLAIENVGNTESSRRSGREIISKALKEKIIV